MSGCSDLQLAQGGLRPLRDLRRWEHSLGELASSRFPFFDQELGIADQIDKQDMPDLESQIGLRFAKKSTAKSKTKAKKPRSTARPKRSTGPRD